MIVLLQVLWKEHKQTKRVALTVAPFWTGVRVPSGPPGKEAA